MRTEAEILAQIENAWLTYRTQRTWLGRFLAWAPLARLLKAHLGAVLIQAREYRNSLRFVPNPRPGAYVSLRVPLDDQPPRSRAVLAGTPQDRGHILHLSHKGDRREHSVS